MYDPATINRYANEETSHPVSPRCEVFPVPAVFKDTAHILAYSSVLNKYPISGCFYIAKLFVGSLLRSAGSEYIANESVRFGSHQPDRIFHKVRSYNNCHLF